MLTQEQLQAQQAQIEQLKLQLSAAEAKLEAEQKAGAGAALVPCISLTHLLRSERLAKAMDQAVAEVSELQRTHAVELSTMTTQLNLEAARSSVFERKLEEIGIDMGQHLALLSRDIRAKSSLQCR